jgi:murein DD-endopeptidase MepM/ murein hydrolase activator NlpD
MKTTQTYVETIAKLIVEFPVRGVWITPNSPGTRIPSHGTTSFGEAYAIDLVMVKEDAKSRKPYQSNVFRYVLRGVPLKDFYGWGQPVYSPINGQVLAVVNDIEERSNVNPFTDLQYMRKATKAYLSSSLKPEIVAGNYILMKLNENQYALLAHLVKGSIKVIPGQTVERNQPIGQLGHSGNSTMPHLHMQFMDNPDFSIAQGIPFVFSEYEVAENGRWKTLYNSIPTTQEIVRKT